MHYMYAHYFHVSLYKMCIYLASFKGRLGCNPLTIRVWVPEASGYQKCRVLLLSIVLKLFELILIQLTTG